MADSIFKLFTDKDTLFECKIGLEGASLKDAQARILVETPELTLMFNGTISMSGECSIPINKLPMLDENTSGAIKLEVIAEDTYFQPWESSLKIEAAKKITVEEITSFVQSKPSMKVEVRNPQKPSLIISNSVKPMAKLIERKLLRDSVVESLISEGITLSSILNSKNRFNNIIDKHLGAGKPRARHGFIKSVLIELTKRKQDE